MIHNRSQQGRIALHRIACQIVTKHVCCHWLVRYLGDVGSGHPFTQPTALHVRGGDGPHLEVVRSHEDVGDAFPHHTKNPFVEVLVVVVGGGAKLKPSQL